MTNPKYYVSRIKAKTSKPSTSKDFGKRDWHTHLKKIASIIKKHTTTGYGWTEHRRLTDYDAIFVNSLNRFLSQKMKYGSLADYIADQTHTLKRPLTILEDGVGSGVIASDIKIMVKSGHRRIDDSRLPHIIGITLKAGEQTKFWKERGKLDEVQEHIGEYFVPKKPVDMILSTYGSIHYTPFPLLKDHLLKYSSSLNKGGIMLAVFDTAMRHSARIISESQQYNEVEYIKKNMNQIEQKFAKMGFKAQITQNEEQQYVIIVQRVR